MRKFFLIIVLLLIFINISIQDLQIVSPRDLRDTLTKLNKGSSGEIKSVAGNFGEIPYRNTINGYIYVHYPYDKEANDWCDPGKFVYIDPTIGDPERRTFPVAIATSNGCPFTVKAKNVQNAKGVALIIISSNNDFEEQKNFDDYDSKIITIPTLIIQKDSGDTIFDYIKNDNNAKIILSISFKSVFLGGKINMQLFLRSDQVKALHFFTEFEQYFNRLGDKLNFTPVYKYTECLFCQFSDSLEDLPLDSCFKEGKFCGAINQDLNIDNSRLVLLENLRQKCIFEKYDIGIYWKYMMKFSEICADLNLPTFDKACSKQVMRLVNIETSKVEDCMLTQITASDEVTNVMKQDYDLYTKYSVHRYPQIIINDIKYKGNWLAQSVFKSVCEKDLSNDPVCEPPKPEQQIDLNYYDEEIGIGTIILVIFIVLFCMLLIVYCYRRIVNKTIEESIEDRIFNQTKSSVGNYSRMDKNNILTS